MRLQELAFRGDVAEDFTCLRPQQSRIFVRTIVVTRIRVAATCQTTFVRDHGVMPGRQPGR